MKNRWILPLMLMGTSAVTGAGEARTWTPRLEPMASNHEENLPPEKQDRTARMLAGRVNLLPMALVDGKGEGDTGTRRATVTFDLPPGFALLQNAGMYQATLTRSDTAADGRARFVYDYEINLDGAHGGVFLSEWNNQSLFVRAPERVAPEQAYILVSARNEAGEESARYPLELLELPRVENPPGEFVLGLWDYEYNRAGPASSGVAALFRDAGVRWTETGDGDYRQALAAAGVATGGYIHHSAYFAEDLADVDIRGNTQRDTYPCAYCAANAPAERQLPGVAAMIDAADQNGGWVSYDYEPDGPGGFCPQAVAAFLRDYGVEREDFETFRAFVAANGRKPAAESGDPVISSIWTKRTDFITKTAVAYAGRLDRELKAARPGATLLNTCSGAFGDTASPMPRALGSSQSELAATVDVVLPQSYLGYGGANVKNAVDWVRGWKRETERLRPDGRLFMMCLVRYGFGVWFGNAPELVRLQTMAMAAEGADGVVYYYPGQMDARHWRAVAQCAADLGRYEAFYRHGVRREDRFPLAGVPRGRTEVVSYPDDYRHEVTDPGYAFFAHEHEGRTLLTLMNLQDADAIVFAPVLAGYRVANIAGGAEARDGGFAVAARDVGYVLLERE